MVGSPGSRDRTLGEERTSGRPGRARSPAVNFPDAPETELVPGPRALGARRAVPGGPAGRGRLKLQKMQLVGGRPDAELTWSARLHRAAQRATAGGSVAPGSKPRDAREELEAALVRLGFPRPRVRRAIGGFGDRLQREPASTLIAEASQMLTPARR